MSQLPVSQLSIISEQEATGEVAEVYNDFRQTTGALFVNNFWLSIAGSTPVLSGVWELTRQVYLQTSLPMSLKAMILYAISSSRDCQYCSTAHEITCRTLEVDKDVLEAIVANLDSLTPVRIQETIKFALKCAHEPRNVSEADYERMRELGTTDEELVEIIGLAGMGVYWDILADAIKMEVDTPWSEELKSK